MLAGNSTRHPSNQENTLARRDETAVPLPGPNVTPEPHEKSRVWQAIVPGTQNKPQDTLQIRKTPWHGVTKQPPAVPLPGPNVTPEPNVTPGARKTSWHGVTAEPNAKIKGLAGNCSRHTKQATKIRKTPWHGVTKQPPALNRMKKSRVWQAIVPGTQTKPQDTLQIRKTPWHGVTKQPPAVPLPGPNVTPEPNEKIKVLAGNSTVPGAKSKPEDTLRIRKTPWHGVTEQPPAVPLPGPNVTPEPNEKSKVLASNSTVPRHRKRARRHPSNQENTLARRDGTASCRPSARAKRHS